jgi:hypothetical protein
VQFHAGGLTPVEVASPAMRVGCVAGSCTVQGRLRSRVVVWWSYHGEKHDGGRPRWVGAPPEPSLVPAPPLLVRALREQRHDRRCGRQTWRLRSRRRRRWGRGGSNTARGGCGRADSRRCVPVEAGPRVDVKATPPSTVGPRKELYYSRRLQALVHRKDARSATTPAPGAGRVFRLQHHGSRQLPSGESHVHRRQSSLCSEC